MLEFTEIIWTAKG